MRFYIAGPITGDPDYKQKFAAAVEIFAKGWPDDIALNPAVLPEGMNPGAYMSICLPMLLMADSVFLLPGWETSAGAKIEKALAEYAGIPVLEFPASWLEEQLKGQGV